MILKSYFTLKNIFFTILLVIGLIFIALIKDIALLFFGSFVLASAFLPTINWLNKYMKRWIAVTIFYILGGLVMICFFVPLISIACQEINLLINNIPIYLKDIEHFVANFTIFHYKVVDYVDIKQVFGSFTQMSTGLINQSINFTINIIAGLTIFVTVAMIVLYMLLDKDNLKASFLRIFPPKLRTRALEVSRNISRKVGGYVFAQAINMVVIGVLTTIGLMFLRIEFAILLGLIAGLLDIVPIIGPAVAIIPGIIVAMPGGPVAVMLVIGVYLLAQWIDNNFIKPVIFGKFLDLHPLIVIFAFFITAQFLGIVGVILAPAIAALVCVLFDEFYLKVLNQDADEIIE